MKLNTVFELFNNIKQCQAQLKDIPSIKFSYCLAKNLRKLEIEVKIAQETINEGIDLDTLRNYEQARLNLVIARAKKDSNGQPLVINGGSYQFETMDEVNNLQAELAEKFPDGQILMDRQNQRAQEIGEQEIVINLYKLAIEYWPDIPAVLMNGLLPLVEE
jgi:hypothetical protein